jgi:hypothetical protein
MIQHLVTKAEAIFLAKVTELAGLQNAEVRNSQPVPPITPETVRMWLSKITHVHGNHQMKSRNHATAWYLKQHITYNPHNLNLQLNNGTIGQNRLLDLILHEMGHLFEYYFFRSRGHGYRWRAIGTIVGYAQVGSTSDERRMQYSAHAAHSGAALTQHSEPIGRLGGTVPRDQSTVQSPVKHVHNICDAYFDTHTRAQIIAMCVKFGINHNTAATQYAAWKRRHRPTFRF